MVKKIMLIFIIKIIKARCYIVKVTNLFKIDFTFVIDQITFYCCANYFGIFKECQREVLDPLPLRVFYLLKSFCVYGCFVYIHVSVPRVFLVPSETIREYHFP